MEQSVSRLMDRLTEARTFDDAAAALLGAALDVAEASLAASGLERGRMLRAMVHLRPDDGYVGLVALDAAPKGAREPIQRGSGAHLPSATAWRWVRTHGKAVALDIFSGEVTVGPDGAGGELPAQKLDAQRSQAMLVARDVTHLFAAPLRSPGGRMDGMLALEASCQAAIGLPFVWATCGATLETLAAIAAPYLTRLPPASGEAAAPDDLLPVIGESMQRVIAMLRVFAEQEETVLLGGPTGAGKSRLARWCHQRSQVKNGPFEVIDLATVPEELQLAELFGWKKGAFTGATTDNAGCISTAEGGTLFVDEIDKLSLRAQAGLLRVLEEKKYRRLGESAGDRNANVRFVIGTNADLSALSRKGTFREDLYYRINVLPVRIPSLKGRRDEIVPWALFMLKRRHAGGGEVHISPDAARLLTAHDWPGNLRQLDNIVRRAYALSLVKQGPDLGGLTLGGDEVKLALEYEGRGAPSTTWEHLERAADAFVAEAEQRAMGEQGKLDMDLADAFKGLVIEAARRRLGGDDNESTRRAFMLLGKESTVESRNHGAFYRREAEKLDKARKALCGGGEPPDDGGKVR